jgi:hypothetical protein
MRPAGLGAKGLFGALEHDQRILAAREQQGGALEGGGHLAQDEDGFFFQRVEVAVAEVGSFVVRPHAGRIPWRLRLPPPAAGAEVLAQADGARAGRAADAGEELVVQRVVGHLVQRDVVPDVAPGPVGQRVELGAHRIGQVEQRHVGTGARLFAAQAGDPGRLAGQRALSGSILRMPQQALRRSMLLYIASLPSRATNWMTARRASRHAACRFPARRCRNIGSARALIRWVTTMSSAPRLDAWVYRRAFRARCAGVAQPGPEELGLQPACCVEVRADGRAVDFAIAVPCAGRPVPKPKRYPKRRPGWPTPLIRRPRKWGCGLTASALVEGGEAARTDVAQMRWSWSARSTAESKPAALHLHQLVDQHVAGGADVALESRGGGAAGRPG